MSSIVVRLALPVTRRHLAGREVRSVGCSTEPEAGERAGHGEPTLPVGDGAR